ncbi:MAG: hypothetical protein N2035_06845 [Chthoniobacterales bacterium]|nr:hypothetical protein [Chthoniobacterales bacterium]
MQAIRELGANYVSLSPIGWSFHLGYEKIIGWGGEEPTLTPNSVRRAIRDAHSVGLKVLLNPQIWVGFYGTPGRWRGGIRMESEEKWEEWFQEYMRFILFWAWLAQEEGVELFSVGSELEGTTRERVEDWRRVIRSVRAVYRGPCTYSANWSGEFESFPLWDELEYIGVSGYFPIGSGGKEERLQAAEGIKKRLVAVSERYKKKPVLFLEVGYRSVAGAGEKPAEWEDEVLRMPDLEEQRLCYEVFFEAFWDEHWFSGAYLWNWYSDPQYRPLVENDYSFRGKPAEGVVRRYFGKR